MVQKWQMETFGLVLAGSGPRRPNGRQRHSDCARSASSIAIPTVKRDLRSNHKAYLASNTSDGAGPASRRGDRGGAHPCNLGRYKPKRNRMGMRGANARGVKDQPAATALRSQIRFL